MIMKIQISHFCHHYFHPIQKIQSILQTTDYGHPIRAFFFQYRHSFYSAVFWALIKSNYYSCSSRSLGQVHSSKTQNLFTLSWKSKFTKVFNDINTLVLKCFFFGLWHHGGCQRPFPFSMLWRLHHSRVRLSCSRYWTTTTKTSVLTQGLANHSLEERAEGLWFLIKFVQSFWNFAQLKKISK